jgi:nucleoid-associated protein YgaU
MQAQPVSNPTTPAQPSPSSDTARTNTQSPAPSDRPSIGASNPPARIAYVIETGDTFSSVAEGWFGDATKWSLIAKANPTIDPQRLKVGQKIYLPPKDAVNASAEPEPVVTNGEPIYLVQSGDTLMRIARNVLGDGAKWEDIYQLNRTAIGKDPAALQVGMKLKLPKKPT